jgi:hypothetical protein
LKLSYKGIDMKVFSLFVAVPFLTVFNVSAESICPEYDVVTDGCTFPKAVEIAMPFTKLYADLWSGQCNQHDRKYQTLGKSKSDSDNEFYSEMKDRCDSKFNKYIAVGLNLECKRVARVVLEVLRNVPENDYYVPNQIKIARHYKETSQKVDNRQCKTTVEKTSFVDANMYATVQNVFKQNAGRKPTAYEKLRLISLYQPAQSSDVYWSDVNYYSQVWGRSSGPNASFIRTSDGMNKVTFNAATSVGSGLKYRWDLNRGTGSSAVFEESFTTQYDEVFYFNGVLEVTDTNNNSDFLLINEQFKSRGECAPTPKYDCF